MFVALSRFVVANGLEGEVRRAFCERAHRVDGEPGFVDLMVMSPEGRREEFWLVTRWRDEESFRTWHGSHQYRDSHAGIPPGLKLVPRATKVEFFEVVAE